MKKYLRMSDVIRLPIGRFTEDGSVGNVIDAIGDSVIYIQQTKDVRTADSRNEVAEYVSHAINSHDELVAMNKELLEALEDIVDSFSPIQNPRDWFRADVHVRTIDIAKSAIAKAKAKS